VITSAYTPSEDEICVGDGVEIKIILIRENLKEGEKQGMVYSIRNPYVLTEKWLIMIGKIDENVCYLKKLVTS